MNKVNLCWVISEGRKGHEIQSIAVADSLAKHVQIHRFTPKGFQKISAPFAIGHWFNEVQWKQKPDFNALPDLIISCGRQAAGVALAIKSKWHIPNIQILNPKGNLSKHDVLLLPEHDQVTADNVCHFTGSIHTYRPDQQKKRSKLTAVFLGNPPAEYWNKQWNQDWQHISSSCENVFLCGSPRLETELKEKIRALKNKQVAVWLDESDGENPYIDLINQANTYYVTADSINMVNETLSTGQTVNLLGARYIHSKRHQRFIHSAEEFLAVRKKQANIQWPNPIDEINDCELIQNLLNSPSSFNKG